MDCLQEYSYYETDIINDKSNSTDLHAYFMTQFNMELENKNKVKSIDNFRFGNEESFDFEVLQNDDADKHDHSLHIIDQVIENTAVDEESIKDVLLDLDTFEFDKPENSKNSNFKQILNTNNDYIDDEYLLDELCREDYDYRLSPELFPDEYTPNTNIQLPSIDTVFSKRHNSVTTEVVPKAPEDMTFMPFDQTSDLKIQNIDYYSYPNNVIYNLNNKVDYILPDTPTSCTEFNFDKRTVSVSESIESDIQSTSYTDENSQNYDDDELFVNLEDFGIHMEQEDINENRNSKTKSKNEKKSSRNDVNGERVCFWENCSEKYPNQSTLVEHIERIHVNSYKGDEFSCLWHNCPRSRRPFNARYKLLIHMRVHSGHKPNRCHHPGCGKAFSRLENLKIHVRSHTGERPYKCPAPHCRKAFSNSSDRAKHQRTHFNARPYACGAIGCGKRYTDPSSLRKHVKSHPHINVPRTCIPSRTPRRLTSEQLVPSSPAKLATLRCIRDKLTVPRMHRM